MDDKMEQPKRPELTEAKAEELLEEILENPSNKFLTEHPKNRESIENADTAFEALALVRELMLRRVESSIVFDAIKDDDGFERIKVNAAGIIRVLESVEKHSESIGEGQDAVVVIFKNEIREFPPEICYKLSKHESTPRGRNSIGEEARMQQLFFDVASAAGGPIGVPEPFYAIDTGNQKIFGMEKLPAVSIDEINRGVKGLPDWVDIDDLCDDLEAFVDLLHDNSLYHRDLHPGNVMISIKAPDPAESSKKAAYIIDCGLSGYGDTIDSYRKTTAHGVFTYNDDCVMIKSVRQLLKQVRRSKQEAYDHDN